MLAERYAGAARDLIERIEATQIEGIRRAGGAIARSLASGGGFWLYRIGHGGEQELHHRAGGLLAARILDLGHEGAGSDAGLEAVRAAVGSSGMRAGDVLMLASVSGRSRVPVEVALAAREAGVCVIALTSLEYTGQVESLHPSGRKLCEVADIVIDNCAPFGDACLEVEGYDHKALPVSGVAHLAIGWMICAEVIERMQAMGKPPHIYQSVNRPGGVEHNERAQREYEELGY